MAALNRRVSVRLDELAFPQDALPYLDDRISSALLDRINHARRPCFDYLQTIEGVSYGVELESDTRGQFLTELRAIAPRLSGWGKTKEHEESATLRLVCCIFSLISEANRKPRIYGTKQPNVVAT
ncbi:hypothetical protein [Bradyrhizobium sp. 188]|uniref:hypothetical protein n=1 Tax=Bradyrhizobium sp. 188 TaxID=2782656 RepID=UPI001FF7AA94|nr:hypothetical protein [Bradyrhizobium sp. 188]MCK1497918.1 hypothetical protein [Bradyrhizobium sp. 188]